MSTSLIEKAISSNTLEKALITAKNENYIPASPFKTEISEVIFGTHLTYRYILVNGLLAKAIDENINPLTLQKGSELKGAYDARSLCHKVLVPFERMHLNNALGGSNEPFLNKPARYQELDMSNPVRNGRDTKMLETLIYILNRINSSELSFQCLTDSIFYALQLMQENQSRFDISLNESSNYIQILDFLGKIAKNSCNGESLVLVIGSLTTLSHFTSDVKILVHPSNQSGASSNEFSDIDVYYKNKPSYGIELKDKKYFKQDVIHAVRKASESSCSRLIFLEGPNAHLVDEDYKNLVEEAIDLGVLLSFVRYDAFINTLVANTPHLNAELLISTMNDVCKLARLKDETIQHYLKTLAKTSLTIQ